MNYVMENEPDPSNLATYSFFLEFPEGDGTDEFDWDRRYPYPSLANWSPVQDKTSLDLATGELELWFRTRSGTFLDLHPGDSLDFSLQVTSYSHFVLYW